jgi:hypothetical protein
MAQAPFCEWTESRRGRKTEKKFVVRWPLPQGEVTKAFIGLSKDGSDDWTYYDGVAGEVSSRVLVSDAESATVGQVEINLDITATYKAVVSFGNSAGWGAWSPQCADKMPVQVHFDKHCRYSILLSQNVESEFRCAALVAMDERCDQTFFSWGAKDGWTTSFCYCMTQGDNCQPSKSAGQSFNIYMTMETLDLQLHFPSSRYQTCTSNEVACREQSWAHTGVRYTLASCAHYVIRTRNCHKGHFNFAPSTGTCQCLDRFTTASCTVAGDEEWNVYLINQLETPNVLGVPDKTCDNAVPCQAIAGDQLGPDGAFYFSTVHRCAMCVSDDDNCGDVFVFGPVLTTSGSSTCSCVPSNTACDRKQSSGVNVFKRAMRCYGDDVAVTINTKNNQNKRLALGTQHVELETRIGASHLQIPSWRSSQTWTIMRSHGSWTVIKHYWTRKYLHVEPSKQFNAMARSFIQTAREQGWAQSGAGGEAASEALAPLQRGAGEEAASEAVAEGA